MENKKIAIIEMLVCAILWSTGGIFIKLIDWNAFAIAGVRSFFSAITVFVFLKFTKQGIRLTKNTLKGGLLMCIAFHTFVLANKLTTAANAIVIQYSLPIFIVVFSAIIFKQKFKVSDIIAVAMTFIGITLFFIDKLESGNIIGNLMAMTAGMCLALMYMTVDRTPAEDRVSVTFFGHLFTAIVGIPFLFIGAKSNIDLTSVIYIVILGVFQLGVPYILYAKATEHCPPLACALLSAIEPVLNPVWVLIFDGETPGIFALIGAFIIILTVTLWCIYGNKSRKEDKT